MGMHCATVVHYKTTACIIGCCIARRSCASHLPLAALSTSSPSAVGGRGGGGSKDGTATILGVYVKPNLIHSIVQDQMVHMSYTVFVFLGLRSLYPHAETVASIHHASIADTSLLSATSNHSRTLSHAHTCIGSFHVIGSNCTSAKCIMITIHSLAHRTILRHGFGPCPGYHSLANSISSIKVCCMDGSSTIHAAHLEPPVHPACHPHV